MEGKLAEAAGDLVLLGTGHVLGQARTTSSSGACSVRRPVGDPIHRPPGESPFTACLEHEHLLSASSIDVRSLPRASPFAARVEHRRLPSALNITVCCPPQASTFIAPMHGSCVWPCCGPVANTTLPQEV
eukprot:365622-Chlamydomonas_euryale.AAC.5